MPADVAQITVAASRDEGERFGDLDGLRLTVTPTRGAPMGGV